MNIETVIDKFEMDSLKLGDIDRAIRYNWLRNAYVSGQLTDDQMTWMLCLIHQVEPKDIPMGALYVPN